MAEESNWILVEKEKNDFKKFEEKEKITKLENELKEMDKKIQKINSDHKNEIEEIKQNFQKLIEENNKQLKEENNAYLKQKDEKINYLEEEIKKANNLFDKRIGDLIKLNNLNSVVSLLNCMEFVKIKNKWSVINGRYKCCNNNCINTNKPVGNCIERHGFGNLINEENIKYIISLKGLGYDNDFIAYAENTFNKPQNSLNYSFYYFEVKCNFERNINRIVDKMHFGLVNQNAKKYVGYVVKDGTIFNENNERCKLSTYSFKNDDIFGCGLVYPPTNKLNEEFPYIFFTQNGKQIGKVVFLKNNSDSYKPFVDLICCSIEANFGNDLETKPFKYDFSEHLVL
uniref:Uncharacterized protein n=1 Tax=Meloidogyne enterolobii TaxID=390850 RepID=A0A6V7VBA1_MELEN|nr:unnamed protein product [Meloidogyne enterolobii]